MTPWPADPTTARSRIRRHGVAFAARLGALLAAAGAALTEPTAGWAILLAVLLAAALSITRPDRVGAAPPIAVLLVAWLAGYGTDTIAPLPRTVGFALLLLVVHECTALASAVPARAYATTAVARRWSTHLVPELLSVALATGAVAITGRFTGSPAADIAGLAAVLVILIGLLRLAQSPNQRDSHKQHRRTHSGTGGRGQNR